MTKTHMIRLKPGEKVKELIQQYVNTNHIRAGWIGSCVGSLTTYSLRFANQASANSADGHFEIVSLMGTLSENGSHLHMSISDSTGKVIGGHLLDGNVVFTTAEIVILEDPSFEFTRENDGTTDWPELQIKKN